MADFGKITDTQMEKTVLRGDHQWTIAGYLWSIYSHRAFHVGNMDIYLRRILLLTSSAIKNSIMNFLDATNLSKLPS